MKLKCQNTSDFRIPTEIAIVYSQYKAKITMESILKTTK